MSKSQLYHTIISLIALALSMFIWITMYRAQFYTYYDAWGKVFTSLFTSGISSMVLFFIWVFNRKVIRDVKWQVLAFLITSGPFTVLLALFFYRELFT